MADPAAAFLATLSQTERLPADQLRLYQRRLLERLLRHARAETDFYPDRLRGMFRGDDSIDWDRWAEIPILTRAEAREQAAALAARSTTAAAGKAIERTTSGSTGQPLRHYTSELQNVASVAANERFFRWHDLDPGALTAFIRALNDPRAAYPDVFVRDGWRPGHPESRSWTLSLTDTPIDRQIEWLLRIEPAHIVSYPSNLAEIARQATAAGVQVPATVAMTMGETTTDDAASAIRDHFGRDPIDRYGATETGLIAATCPHSRPLSRDGRTGAGRNSRRGRPAGAGGGSRPRDRHAVLQSRHAVATLRGRRSRHRRCRALRLRPNATRAGADPWQG